MSNVIFLDFDGVLHPVGSCVWDADKQQMQAQGAFRWWPILHDLLLQSPVPVELVVHSTWRLMWETDEELLALLPPAMRPYVRGVTDRSCMGREASIVHYVAHNRVDNFVVVDDEPAAFAPDYAPLIACSSATGLSMTSVLHALEERLLGWSPEYKDGPGPETTLSDSRAIDNERASTTALLLNDFSAQAVDPHLARAKFHAIVQRDDAQLLVRAVEDYRNKYWYAPSILQDLWYSALLEGKTQAFTVLCTLAQEKDFFFSVPAALDAMPESYQLWVLNIPLARNLWLSQSESLSARLGTKMVNGLNVLCDNPFVVELRTMLDAKPAAFHECMRLFIKDFAMQTLMKNGAFLHTIAYYAEPNKKHLRVAATGPQPVYDFERMEKYWPRLGDAVLAMMGLGLPVVDCAERIRKMISNKHAAVAAKEEHVSLPSDFTPA